MANENEEYRRPTTEERAKLTLISKAAEQIEKCEKILDALEKTPNAVIIETPHVQHFIYLSELDEPTRAAFATAIARAVMIVQKSKLNKIAEISNEGVHQ